MTTHETAQPAEPSQVTQRGTSNLFKLNGRTYFVTGGIGALGQAVVTSIMQCGGDVVCLDYIPEPPPKDWEKLLAIATTQKVQLLYSHCDVTSSEKTRAAFEAAVSASRFPLRGLVTCAGTGTVAPSAEASIDDFKRTIDVNLTGTFICAQAAAQILFARGWSASMVFIASMSGHVVNKGLPTAAYSASKAGVHQLTRNLAAEWGRNDDNEDTPIIRVNSLSPGYIRTPLTRDLLGALGREKIMSAENMLNRISEPEEHGGAVVFLLSDASTYVTGTDLIADGGHTRW